MVPSLVVVVDSKWGRFLRYFSPLTAEKVSLGGGVTFSIVRPLPNLRFLREVSDWSIVIMSTLPNSLTGSRGEYLRVVVIHSDG